MRAGVSAHTFTILLTLSSSLILARGDNVDFIARSPGKGIVPRQASSGSVAANTTPAAAASTTPTQAATSQQAATSATPASSAQPQQSSTPTQQSTTPQQESSTTSTISTNNNKPTNGATSSPTTITSALVTTNPAGQVVTSLVIVAATPSASSPPSQTAGSSSNSSSSSSGVGTSTIIGLSVAGGVAVLCVIGFFVWKFTRKRIGAYDNNEEIKWPELNAHDTGVPLPTHRTGGSGFDTGLDANRSSIGYADSTANSTTELPPDPYAIPPLPHLDPNQPYRDDPTGAFYDPYRGPVPQSFNPVGPGEVIPMTQLAGGGRRSPGPGAAYAGDFASGRASPGPGRVSPAPGYHAPYGSNDFGGRASPGPRAAQQGRMSPGPQAAFGNAYNPR